METPPPIDFREEKRLSRKPKGPRVHAAYLPLAFLLGLAMGYLAWSRPATGTNQATPTAGTQADSPQNTYKRYDIPVDDDPMLGPSDAPVTLVMYSDYECPYCRKWYEEVFKPLRDDYQGKIRFVYKDFPLYGLHANAAPAAEAANCAGDQGKYWEFQDKLFSMEQKLGTDGFTKYASDLSLDQTKFSACLTSRKYEKEVQADYDFATNLGVQSTPTFFINGLAVVGAQPLNVFTNIIDQELAGKLPKE